MKKFALLAAGCMILAACGPTHVRDEVREVETGDTIVSDGWTDVVYQGETDPKVSDPNALLMLDDEYEPSLYVNVTDIESGQVFKVHLGYDCKQFPIPKGVRFLAKFDISAYKEKPETIYFSPYADPISTYLCG